MNSRRTSAGYLLAVCCLLASARVHAQQIDSLAARSSQSPPDARSAQETLRGRTDSLPRAAQIGTALLPMDYYPLTTIYPRPELRHASPGFFGIGMRAGVVEFAGDLQQPLKFPGTRTPWFFSGDLSLQWRFLRVNDSLRLGLEVSGGYRHLAASYSGYEFSTRAYPATISLLAELYPLARLRPVLSFGVGALPYDLTVLRNSLEPLSLEQTGSEHGVTGWVQIRAGVTYSLSKNLDFRLLVERSITLSDRLDGLVSNKLTWLNDNFNVVSAGITWFITTASLTDDDADGVSNTDELAAGTDPERADTDGDGLNDGRELLELRSNPLSQDSDNDGIPDQDEVAVFHSSPVRRDTDNDGINDKDELAALTDPLVADTDHDGILDGRDRCPRVAETLNGFEDEDGCPDVRPAMVSPSVAPDYFRLGQIFVVENMEFDLGKATITPASLPSLTRLAATLKANPDVWFEIGGHTDSTGNFERNIELSSQRANAVRDFLVAQGVAPNRITARGYGPTRPVATNTTADGRARNRRIEFRITKSGK